MGTTCTPTGLTQKDVETIVNSILLKLLNNGTLQAGLRTCKDGCATPLAKGTQVPSCSDLSNLTCTAAVVVGSTPVINTDVAVPTDSVGTDTYLLATPDLWDERQHNGHTYVSPLYKIS